MEKWSSRTIYLLALIGSAVGLGNIWRFPYLLNEYGLMLIPAYIVSVLVVGIPVLLLEITAGKTLKKHFLKLDSYYPILAFIANIIILSYYLVVTSWTFAYIFSIDVFGTWNSLIVLAIVLALIYLIDRTEIKKGLEKANTYLTSSFIILFLIFSAYILLNHKIEVPIKEDLFSVNLWSTAITHALFSLSAGFGLIYTYSLYSKDKNYLQDSLIVASADTIIGLLAGITIVSFATTQGPTLIFQVLPNIFLTMPYGLIIEKIFFILLFFIALTSSLSMLEPLISYFEIKEKREQASKKAIGIIAILSFIVVLSYTPLAIKINDQTILALLDEQITPILVPIASALFITTLLKRIKIKGILRLSYIASAILFIIFLLEIIKII